jgi:hypothetical protein
VAGRQPTRERWDLVIDGLGLLADRSVNGKRIGAARVGTTSTPTDEDQRAIQQDVPRDWTSFEAGACYTQDLGFNGYAYSDGATAAWGPISLIGQVVSQPVPTDMNHVRTSFEWKGKLYVVGATKVIRMPLGGGTTETLLDIRTSTPASATNEIEHAALYKDHLVVGAGVGPGILQFDGASWLQAAGSPVVKRLFLADQFWRIDGIGAHRLLGATSSIAFAHTSAAAATTATNGIFDDNNWSTEIGSTTLAMTDATYRVTGLVKAPSSVLFLTEGGAMEVDQTGHATNRTPYWGSFKSTIGKQTDGLLAGNYAYLPHSNGLDRMDVRSRLVNGPTGWCQPGLGLENATPVFGRPGAMEYFQGAIFGAFYNGSDSWLCLGRDRAELGTPGVGPMVWHTFKKFADVQVGGLKAVTDPLTGRPYLWIFAKNEDTSVAYAWRMDLPDNGTAVQDLLYGSGMSFETDGEFYLTRETLGKPTLYKALRRFEITGRRLGDPYVSLYANADEAGYVFQGTVREKPGRSFLARTARMKQLDIRLDLHGASSASPLFVDAVRMTGRYSPPRSEARTYTVRIGTTDRDGKSVKRDPLLVWTELRAKLESGPVSMTDEIGERLLVDVIDVRSVGSELAADDSYERLAEVTLVELRSRSRYNASSYYDRGASYG